MNLVLNFINMKVLHLGHAGLALTTSCVALINMSQLFFALRRRVDLGPWRVWASFLVKAIAASALCAAVAYGVEYGAQTLTSSRLILSAALFVAIGAGGAGYFLAAQLFKLEESKEAWAMIARRVPGLRR